MRHRKYTFKIGKTSAHRRAMMANMVSSLIYEGRIKTTLAKAKEARRVADRMVTLGKKGTLHARRQAIAKLRDPDAVRILFNEVAPTFKDRQGGYTRMIKIGPRVGDGAEMCLLEYITESLENAPVEPAAAEESVDTEASAETEESTEQAAAAEEIETEESAETAEQAEPEAGEGEKDEEEASSEEKPEA